MDKHIAIMCVDLRKNFEAIRADNESEIENLKDAIKAYGFDPGPSPSFISLPDGVVNEQFDQEKDLYDKKEKQQRDELDDEDRRQVETFEEQLEELEDQIAGVQWELAELIENYPQILFLSLFIAVYSHFEKYLFDLCDSIRESESLSMGPKELQGSTLAKIQKYFHKVARIKFPDDTEEWQDILLLCEVRNKMVHHPEYHYWYNEKHKIKKLRNKKLLDYFWLDDTFFDYELWDGDDELRDIFDVESFNFMFTIDSIQKIINTFGRFAKDIDKEWKEHNNLRKKFLQGPKHKK